MRILLEAGFSPDDAAGISRLLSAHVLDSVPPPRDEPAGPGPVLELMRDYPNLGRVAPAFGRLSDQDIFELGVEIILDGLARRLEKRPAGQAL